ncbi:unnamed protein product [Hymenolepis diminuta]|uniref:Uncharacterized protein n=1 Tax=Hymenolepis diminuta TaxID=6216 RepID=A0A564Y7V2_HYMDI|nr:unnamed protein product [Hymenolepis diminuta]
MTEHRNLEIVRFLKVATSFVCKAREKSLNENNGDELTTTRKRKQEHCQSSADPLTHSLNHSEHLNLWEECMAWDDMMDEFVRSQCATSCRRSSSVCWNNKR